MESPTECIRRWFHWWFRRWKCHVTVRLSQFESVGKIVWKNSTSPHRCIFPNKLYRPSAIQSVYTDKNILSVYTDHIADRVMPSVYTHRIADGVMPSVYTDRIGDGIISIGKNYRRKYFVGNSVGFRRFSGSVKNSIHKINIT